MILLGRTQVIMPITKEDFYNDIEYALKTYLGGCVDIHNQNVKEIEYLNEVYKGKHDILDDKKRFDSSDINNKTVENHLKTIADFKVAFMYGNPLDYSIMNAKNSDDMKYIIGYFVEQNKASLDVKKAKDLYKFGLAYQMILPKTSSEIKDIKAEAPFKIKNMPVTKTCMVYSDDIPSEPLFGMVIGKRRYVEEDNRLGFVYNIYLPNRRILVSDKYDIIEDVIQSYDFIPIVEYILDEDRMGIVEVGLEAQNALNKADSMQLDEIEENINSFIAFFNQRTDDDFLKKFQDFKKQRVLLLNTNDPQRPADLKMVSCAVNSDAHNLYYERKKKALYDICTTPQGSGNVTSGGDTGQARLLGNGWESAQNQAQLDKTALLEYERQLIKNVLSICTKYQGCPVNEVSVSDIAIKFNINMSNNLLVKAEAVKMLNEAQLPEKTILKATNITNDVDGEGNAWIQNKEKIRQQEMEMEKQISEQQVANNDENKENKIGF